MHVPLRGKHTLHDSSSEPAPPLGQDYTDRNGLVKDKAVPVAQAILDKAVPVCSAA